jgi:ubiquinone/menaquinone biosynthesis C-methylase UbiE
MTTSRAEQTPAQAYQEYFGPAIFEPLAEELIGCLAPRVGGRVLDVACGTGIVTRRAAALAGASGSVTGVDLNPGMLAVAVDHPAVDGARPTFRQGDAQGLELPEGCVDVVYCQQGLQFMTDRPRALTEMRRVLDDRGRVAVACWRGLDHHPLYAALAEAEVPYLQAFGVDVTADDVVAPFSLGDAEELSSLLATAGFHDIDVVDRTIEATFATPERFVERMQYAYAAVVPAFADDPAVFADYLRKVDEATRDVVDRYRRDGAVVVPMHTHIATARA